MGGSNSAIFGNHQSLTGMDYLTLAALGAGGAGMAGFIPGIGAGATTGGGLAALGPAADAAGGFSDAGTALDFANAGGFMGSGQTAGGMLGSLSPGGGGLQKIMQAQMAAKMLGLPGVPGLSSAPMAAGDASGGARPFNAPMAPNSSLGTLQQMTGPPSGGGSMSTAGLVGNRMGGFPGALSGMPPQLLLHSTR